VGGSRDRLRPVAPPEAVKLRRGDEADPGAAGAGAGLGQVGILPALTEGALTLPDAEYARGGCVATRSMDMVGHRLHPGRQDPGGRRAARTGLPQRGEPQAVLESADAGQEDAGAGAVADAAEAVDEGPATAVSGPDPVDEEELTGAGAEDVVLTDVCDAVEERVGAVAELAELDEEEALPRTRSARREPEAARRPRRQPADPRHSTTTSHVGHRIRAGLTRRSRTRGWSPAARPRSAPPSAGG